MTINLDTTAEQDAAIIKLRKLHNRLNGSDLTNKQYAEKRTVELLQGFIYEVTVLVDREAVAEAYRLAMLDLPRHLDEIMVAALDLGRRSW